MNDSRISEATVQSDTNNKLLEDIAMQRLRKLAANLMKIAGGTGKLYDVENEVLGAAAALTSFREKTGVGIDPSAISDALVINGYYDSRSVLEKAERERVEAELETVCGSLGVAAWHLAGKPQGRTTHEKMRDGATRLNRRNETRSSIQP